MLKLKEIILQLDEDKYKSLEDDFVKNKAKNSHYLLQELRKDVKPEKEICNELGLSSNAFYALKSRLLDKIQNHMPLITSYSKEELINTLAKIPEICSSNPRETANAILQKLETDLKEQGMHNELLPVYSALKRINLYTPKYYSYSQQYNKQVAFMVSLEKADEICCEFSKLASDYILSKNPALIDSLGFLKQKIDNIFELNASKQVLFIRNIIHIQYHLFTHKSDEADLAVLLNECETLLNETNSEMLHASYRNFLDFLFFEYYLSVKKNKQAEQYFDKLASNITNLLLHNYIGCVTPFLGSAFYFCATNKQLEKKLPTTENILFDQADTNNLIELNYYNALLACKAGDTKKAKSVLLKTINDYSMVNFLRAEIEIKICLCFFLLLEKDFDMADDYLRKILRKIKALPSDQFLHIEYIIKFFDMLINKESTTKTELKKKEIFTLFVASNTNQKEVLRPLIPILVEKYGLA